MRVVIASFLVVSSLALADVPGVPQSSTSCDAPSSCQTCSGIGGPDAECAANAQDAGLQQNECEGTSTRNPNHTYYFCPAGTAKLQQTCGCSAAGSSLAVAALGLFSVLRRRARR